ncbi:MAG: hypothetical protein SynsKO_14050 [Synoicihabitans sp.]
MKPDNVIRLMAGSFVLLSVALTYFVSPWGLLLGLFVGIMLVVSATTGFCPPTLLFTRLGWIDSQGNVSPLAAKPAATPVPGISPEDAAERLANDKAVLVDVREPDEWQGGVAAGARLLPLSDFRGGKFWWRPFLNEVGGREICLYCGSGARATIVARELIAQGHRVNCVGGFSDWCAAQQKVQSAPT